MCSPCFKQHIGYAGYMNRLYVCRSYNSLNGSKGSDLYPFMDIIANGYRRRNGIQGEGGDEGKWVFVEGGGGIGREETEEEREKVGERRKEW